MLRKTFVVCAVVVGVLLAPSVASATISSVFGSVTCTEQTSGETKGQRWCGSTQDTMVNSFDGTPIDVSVGFPVASGSDNNYPIVAVFEGWGGTKVISSNARAQRYLKEGYAVFSMSSRGWGESCNKYTKRFKESVCEHGATHVASMEFEAHDAQYMLGLLADEGLINPQEIGATGISFGGIMAIELGALKDRVELETGEFIPWVSPKGKAMKIAATVPEYGATELLQALQPNGSQLDYVADDPYEGLFGEHLFGIQKQNWVEALYAAAELLSNIAQPPLSGPELEANLKEWYEFDGGGGPYYETNGSPKPLTAQQEELVRNHSAYYVPLTEEPAPALMENGWNDDLMIPNQGVDYYNKVRSVYPNAAIKLFDMDYGHLRSLEYGNEKISKVALEKLDAAQNGWLRYYLKGEGSEPAGAHGGVTAITSACPIEAKTTGEEFTAANWASLASGEINFKGAAEQTITAPGTAPKTAFTETGTTVCSTEAYGENSSAATYTLAAAPAEGFTIAGSPTVVAEFSTPGQNGQVIARLMDVESGNVPVNFTGTLTAKSKVITAVSSETGLYTGEGLKGTGIKSGTTIVSFKSAKEIEMSTEAEKAETAESIEGVGPTAKLIARGVYRPEKPGAGFTKQVFQLYPQAWKVASGHILRLQLLAQDSKYVKSAPSPESVKVENLELRIPTIQAPGSDGGLVTKPLPKYLPTGYTLARNVATTVPGVPHLSSGATPNKTGVFTLAWEPSQVAAALTYTLQHKNASGGWSTVASGLTSPEYAFTAGSPEAEGTWTYRVSASNEGPETEHSGESAPVVVDETPPNAPTAKASREPDYAGGGGWYKDSVEVSFTSNGDPNLSDGSPGSGVNPASIPASETFSTSGSHTACGTVSDNAGNVSGPGCVTVQVDATPPSLEITCPATATVGSSANATFTASDEGSGLASEPSGTVPIDTSSVGEQTVSTTAIDNVGHETTKSCTTEVEAPVVEIPTPGAPTLSAGTTPNNSGLFTLSWSGDNPMTSFGLSYTLQHENHNGTWSTVASGIEALSYEFSGAGEEEGTWVYRVQGSDPGQDVTTEWSPTSAPVVVDETPPNAPTAKASREPDYAGGGGWYKDSVEVSFTSNGDPNLSDGSPGSGVNPASIPASETFSTSGSHTACGTVSDNAGNVSGPGCVTVQVDATPPSLEITCPARVAVGSSANATFTASDEGSGLASEPSGTVPIDTSSVGEQTVSTTAIDNVGHETTKSCTTEVEAPVVEIPTPGAPTLSAGTTPNNSGLFTLSWSGDNPMTSFGLSYTLQHENHNGTWSTVASGIEALSYEFVAPEEEGTWVYRVQGSDPGQDVTTEWSPTSAPVVVDETPPNAPTAKASREPDYAGGGGWYKDSVEVSFTSNGDPNLSDGSPGSGVNPASIPASETFSTSGSHTACGTVSDNAGNVSGPGCVTVQVDATPPSLEITCPATVAVGATGVDATVTASDGYSGLKTNPSGTVPISTSKAGPQTVTRTAVSNVGLETTKSCTTEVGFTRVITGAVGKLVVNAGEAVELTSTATVSKPLTVNADGALDVEGASTEAIKATGATLIRICGASVGGAVKVTGSSGSVVIGEGTAECGTSTFSKTVTIKGNTAGVSVDEDVFDANLKVTENASGTTVTNNKVTGSLIVKGNTGGTTVTNNKVTGSLTVKGNTGLVVDKPNEVKGKSKLQ